MGYLVVGEEVQYSELKQNYLINRINVHLNVKIMSVL